MSDIAYAVQSPLAISRVSSEALQQQIARQIRERIIDGRFPLGSRLTSIREMAVQLELSLNTVKLAYQQLISEGYLETTEGRGTFVAHALPEDTPQPTLAPMVALDPDRHAIRFPPAFRMRGRVIPRQALPGTSIDFWPGRTDPRAFPSRRWRHLIGESLLNAAAMTDYGDAQGHAGLRHAIAEHLGRARGFRPDPARIIVTSGIQEALCICAKLLLEPGATAVTEAPCYAGASSAFEGFGARIMRVEVDEAGLTVDALPRGRVALAYVTPSHQFPLGRTLSMERRSKILQWAADSGAYIVEDDYDSDFRFETSPLPALASLDDRGSVIYLGTFSKAMGAGIRLGYMVAPQELVGAAINVKSLFSISHEWLTQATMAAYIASGDYAKRLRRMRHDGKRRRDSLVEALQRCFGDITLRGLSGGMHIVWRLPAHFASASVIEALCADRRVGVYSPRKAGADMTYYEALNERLLVFGYASLTPAEISKGIGLLAECVRQTG